MGKLIPFPKRNPQTSVLRCNCPIVAGRFAAQAGCPVHGTPGRCGCVTDGATFADASQCPIHDGFDSPATAAVQAVFAHGTAMARLWAAGSPEPHAA